MIVPPSKTIRTFPEWIPIHQPHWSSVFSDRIASEFEIYCSVLFARTKEGFLLEIESCWILTDFCCSRAACCCLRISLFGVSEVMVDFFVLSDASLTDAWRRRLFLFGSRAEWYYWLSHRLSPAVHRFYRRHRRYRDTSWCAVSDRCPVAGNVWQGHHASKWPMPLRLILTRSTYLVETEKNLHRQFSNFTG